MLQLEGGRLPEDSIPGRLTYLKARYKFLEQVYKYHSNVEDEVSFFLGLFLFFLIKRKKKSCPLIP